MATGSACNNLAGQFQSHAIVLQHRQSASRRREYVKEFAFGKPVAPGHRLRRRRTDQVGASGDLPIAHQAISGMSPKMAAAKGGIGAARRKACGAPDRWRRRHGQPAAEQLPPRREGQVWLSWPIRQLPPRKQRAGGGLRALAKAKLIRQMLNDGASTTEVVRCGFNTKRWLPLVRLQRSDDGPSVGYAQITKLAKPRPLVGFCDVPGPQRTSGSQSSAAVQLHQTGHLLQAHYRRQATGETAGLSGFANLSLNHAHPLSASNFVIPVR
tara:strand:- start:968 stop:1774 length:807 start_codon:yes stop_codon:yes gene_type:complete